MSDSKYSADDWSPFTPLYNELVGPHNALMAEYNELHAQQLAHSEKFLVKKTRILQEIYDSIFNNPHLATEVHFVLDHPLMRQLTPEELSRGFKDEGLAMQMSTLNAEITTKNAVIEALLREEERYKAEQREKRRREQEQEQAWEVECKERDEYVRSWAGSNTDEEVERDESAEGNEELGEALD
ncbi:hypothetical protein FRC07_013473 [Ceratobasidium sp. 392]|nr:hypothetical protein FRC07_013473 [Ceratobasidium sp. 392]